MKKVVKYLNFSMTQLWRSGTQETIKSGLLVFPDHKTILSWLVAGLDPRPQLLAPASSGATAQLAASRALSAWLSDGARRRRARAKNTSGRLPYLAMSILLDVSPKPTLTIVGFKHNITTTLFFFLSLNLLTTITSLIKYKVHSSWARSIYLWLLT